MKQIKVSEATPIQLDWLVAKCNGDFALYHNIEPTLTLRGMPLTLEPFWRN